MIFLSIRHIPHLSFKFEQFWIKKLFWCTWPHAYKILKRFLRTWFRRLTVQAGVLNPRKKNSILNYFFFKRVQIYMKDAECTKTNGKSTYRFLLRVMIIFVPKSCRLSMNFQDNLENCFSFDFAHLSLKREQNWWGNQQIGVAKIFVREVSNYIF